jgi:ribosomal protein S18 acetylase RimI-like enzyme
MASQRFKIRRATQDKVPDVIACIVASFITDPLMRFIWPTPRDYFHAMPLLTQAFLDVSIQNGSAYMSADCCGAALWLPPGARVNETLIEKRFLETGSPAHLIDFLSTSEKMDRCHPNEPHWYLPLIGVEPKAQGLEIGGALMRHGLIRCDEEKRQAYLESSNPLNIPFYLSYGFNVMEAIQIGDCPPVTPMLRPPR